MWYMWYKWYKCGTFSLDLANIKDRAATTSKYDNKIIKFKTPNIVMVFSNRKPDLNSLSKDRWNIYNPTLDGLKSCKIRSC